MKETEADARNHSIETSSARTLGSPPIATLDKFTLSHRPRMSKNQIAELEDGKCLREHDDVSFPGPPGAGKTRLAIVLGVRACHRGDRVLYETASGLVTRL